MESQSFDSVTLSEPLRRAIADAGYTKMTPIQQKIIPLVLEGLDVIGKSSTGTGKTAAFGVPAVEMVRPGDSNAPQVLVLLPTRELALQVCDELRKFSKYKEGVRVVPVYGGQSIINQIKQLKKAEIVVGTPGRVIDHLHRRTLTLSNLRMLVLDEADEMLNMGFLDDIKTILHHAPAERQTVLFSATMPTPILRLTQRFQKNAQLIEGDDGQAAFHLISQYYCEVPRSKKVAAVLKLFESQRVSRGLIFCNTKRMVDLLADGLNERGLAAVALHGDIKQSARTKIMQDFKAGKTNVLIATDVAARGIDASGVEIIINYDLPQDAEYYTHRIGRTGRAGNVGAAYSLIAGSGQFFDLANIEDATGAKLEPFPIEGLEDSPEDKHAKADKAARVQRRVQRAEENLRKNGVTRVAAQPAMNNPENVLVSVDVGRRHGVAPNHIVGALTDEAKLKRDAIGKITVGDTESYIELSPENARTVMKLSDATIKSFVVVFALHDAGGAAPKPKPSGPRPGGSRRSGPYRRKRR